MRSRVPANPDLVEPMGPLGLLAPSLGLGPSGPVLRTVQNRSRRFCRTDGPAGIRTQDQGIHSAPAFPPGVDYLFTRERGTPPVVTHSIRVGAGCSCLSLRALEPSGSLCTFRRCTAGSAQDCHELDCDPQLEGSPEFIPSTVRVSAPRHLFDESPALTAVLQAQCGADCSSLLLRHVYRLAVPAGRRRALGLQDA